MTELGSWQRPNAEELVLRLGISRAAAELYLASEVIDLHVESFSFTRSFGYDLLKRHELGWNRAFLFGQADLPRLLEIGLSGAIWSITANPLRPPEDRGESFPRHLGDLKERFEGAAPHVEFVRSAREYRTARARGKQAAFIGVQGANALPRELDELALLLPDLVKICLLHLTSSAVGSTSTPSFLPGSKPRLGARGVELIRLMNERRVLVDLAHIHERAFWEAVAHSDPSTPLIVSHTGVSAVHPHWRNLDDAQLRAVADRGGTIGLIYHSEFLGDGLFRGKLSSLVRHIRHTLDVVGDEHVSLGSDWDGLICTPRDMPTCLELPRLVEALLRSGVRETSVAKILGLNFLRVLEAIDRDALLRAGAS